MRVVSLQAGQEGFHPCLHRPCRMPTAWLWGVESPSDMLLDV
jgi:hypothetical protein